VNVIKAYGGVEVELHSFLNFELDRNELPASPCVHFISGEGYPNNSRRRLGGSQGLSGLFKKEKFFPLPRNKSQFVGLTAYSLVTVVTELLQFVVTCFKILNS